MLDDNTGWRTDTVHWIEFTGVKVSLYSMSPLNSNTLQQQIIILHKNVSLKNGAIIAAQKCPDTAKSENCS